MRMMRRVKGMIPIKIPESLAARMKEGIILANKVPADQKT